MRVEVLGGPERRRRWRLEDKARLVAQTFEPGVSVCTVARRHGIAPGLLFTWRRQAREGRLGGPEPAPLFVPVQFAPREGSPTSARPLQSLSSWTGATPVPAGHSCVDMREGFDGLRLLVQEVRARTRSRARSSCSEVSARI